MKVNEALCVGCGNCIAVCPMGARYVEDEVTRINDDECVECGACLRFGIPENVSAGLMRTLHTVLEAPRLQYDAPLDICPTGAMYQDDLEWPRVIRQAFSDPTVTHAGTGVSGRGTEEIKTNDVTGRLEPGWAGVLVEFGRPGLGARFHDVNRVATTLAELEGIQFEPKNPVTQLMPDPSTGAINPEVLDEKVMSCILEVLVPLESVPRVLAVLEGVFPSLDSVASAVINGRCGPNGEIPYAAAVAASAFNLSPNGKNNLGLGRPGVEATGTGGGAR